LHSEPSLVFISETSSHWRHVFHRCNEHLQWTIAAGKGMSSVCAPLTLLELIQLCTRL
jgi:hypothetical protein